MIIEDLVAEVLEDGGFTGPFIDHKGIEQPSPVLQTIYLNELDPNAESNRILFIRENGGGGGSRFVQRSAVSIYFIGLKSKADTPTVKNQANEILSYLLETRQNCGIINIDPTVGATPLMFTDSGRPIVEIQTTVLIDRGIN